MSQNLLKKNLIKDVTTNLEFSKIISAGKERRDRKTRAQTQRYLYRRPTLSGRYKYMVRRGDGLTSIRIYLSNDLKINAHEKNDFNDSAIGGTPIAFLRTETQYAKAGHLVRQHLCMVLPS